jgi:hypothetical protein
MSRLATITLLAAVLTASASGCGGGETTTRTPNTTTGRVTSSDPAAALERAVRQTLRENYRLSGYVLWYNSIPASAPRSTRGPALAGLRSAAAQRRQRGIRLRPVTGHLKILTVKLDPSFSRATATTEVSGRVRPYRAGRPLGQSIAVHERARVQLRRLGRSQQFVVWQVTVVR